MRESKKFLLNILLSTADVNDHKRIASVLNDLSLAEAVFKSQCECEVLFNVFDALVFSFNSSCSIIILKGKFLKNGSLQRNLCQGGFI